NFTRDLFEAQLSLPNFSQPVHIFTTHLKSGNSSSDDAARRGAEALAISNFFVTGFLTTNASHPYLLTGDMNEDIARPSTGSQQPIQRMVNAATGLQLTTPLNPFTSDDRTFSIQAASLSKRYDYILPGGILFSNIVSSQVFRTDLLNPVPPALQQFDDKTASDHLPVLMIFSNPYQMPFGITSINVSDQFVTLNWQSEIGRQYQVQNSSNLINWTTLATNLIASGTNFIFTTNLTDNAQFFRIYRAP
ncbi:MAG: hypothetical protein M3Y82_09150, partial [Verrucomicrobiota bacterium]|nr:hypothetical protein [Verrucomicrobiota bacterium]